MNFSYISNMKKLLFLFVILCMFYCSSKDDRIVINSGIVGKWKAIEMIDDMITEEEIEIGNQWETIENGDITEFYNNGTFQNLFLDCEIGNYSLQDNSLHFNCNSGESSIFSFSLENNNDILIVSTGFVSKKYIRVE